jgi:glycosyltransferase involved in cell wall biosynthesis
MSLGITVVMPLLLRHPGEHRRALESVLSQKCEVPLELLIIDDGSEIPVPASDDPRVRIVRLTRNYGVTYALNAGLTQARYDWIARIDGDDFWRPGKLARQWAMLQADPDLTLVASGMRLVHPAKPQLDRDELRGGDWAHVLALAERIGCPFPHGGILGRREVFEILGGYPQGALFQHGEDFALWAQWVRFFEVAICDEIFLEYTVSEGQISSRFAQEQLQASEAARWMLGAPKGVPSAVQEIAGSLGMSLFEASSALFTAWRFYEYVLVDNDIFEAAAAVLPDRAVHRVEEIDKLLADRFFYLTTQKRTASLPFRSR